MARDGFKFISKMLDSKNAHAFGQYNITERKLPTPEEREVFRYLSDYIEKNGSLPSPEEVSALYDDFIYVPNVSSSFDYLAEQINNDYAKLELTRAIQGKVGADDEFQEKVSLADLINEKKGLESVDWLIEKLEQIKKNANHVDKIGHDIKTDHDWLFEEYERRKEGKTFKVWPSRFTTINKILGGGYASGNMYTFYARSGRGKSIVVLEEAIEAAMNGATVLYWALEMPKYELFARAFSSVSARHGVFNAKIDGVDYQVGFPQKEILMAKMSDQYYDAFKNFVTTMNQRMKGTIIFRCIDDPEFVRRDCKQLEADIRQTGAHVVVIDPIYFMSMERNESQTAGGDVAATSKRLRLMAGNLNVVMHVVTQSEETKEQYAEDGERQLSVPKRNEMKKSKQLLEDASMTIGLDTKDGRGIIMPGKGRSGGEDEKIEIIFLPNYGLVKELPTMEEATKQFKTKF
jgi:replicative DNA helicase